MTETQTDTHRHPPPHLMGWGRLAGMIDVSTVAMFFLMYQLVFRLQDATFSMNRLLAALVMACVMIVVMLGSMWPMYRGTGTKVAVLAGAALTGLALLSVNRTQALIGDTAFLRAMIPHHSIAINNASKATIRDLRIRDLADGIIRSQVKEIAAMQQLLVDIGDAGANAGPRGPALTATPPVLTPDLAAEAAEMAR